jgi:hypothetical protein
MCNMAISPKPCTSASIGTISIATNNSNQISSFRLPVGA